MLVCLPLLVIPKPHQFPSPSALQVTELKSRKLLGPEVRAPKAPDGRDYPQQTMLQSTKPVGTADPFWSKLSSRLWAWSSSLPSGSAEALLQTRSPPDLLPSALHRSRFCSLCAFMKAAALASYTVSPKRAEGKNCFLFLRFLRTGVLTASPPFSVDCSP